MATSFFGGAFFGGEFFFSGGTTPVVDVVKTGTGGIDRKGIVKPTGLVGRRKKGQDERVEKRVEETREIHEEITSKLARELEPPEPTISLSDVDREIGMLLRKVQRTQEEELLLLILMCA